MEETPVTLQQQIYQDILKKGEWTDPSGLLKITGYLSESAGELKPGPNGFDVWFPQLEEADIDVLKPSADKLGEYKGRQGINKLRRLFNEVRFALPGGLKYRLHADDAVKAYQYKKWTTDDPLVTVADTAEKPHRKDPTKRVKYDVLDLEQPKGLIQIGNYKGTKRVVYLLPETNAGLQEAYKIDAAYQAIVKTGGRKAAWGIKPYFIDGKGDFYEMESGGPGYKKGENDYGYRPKKIDTHRKASFNYAMRKRGATPTLEYVTDWVRKTFTNIPEDQVIAFGEMYYALNKGEINDKTAQRVMSNISEHGDHSIALSKGGVNWYTNITNIPGDVNLKKGGTNTPAWYNEALGISSNVDEVLKGGLSSPIVNPEEFKYQAYNNKGLNLSPELARQLGITDSELGIHHLFRDPPDSPDFPVTPVKPDTTPTTNLLNKIKPKARIKSTLTGLPIDAVFNPNIARQLGIWSAGGDVDKQLVGEELAWEAGQSLLFGPLYAKLFSNPLTAAAGIGYAGYMATDAFVEGRTGRGLTERQANFLYMDKKVDEKTGAVSYEKKPEVEERKWEGDTGLKHYFKNRNKNRDDDTDEPTETN